MAFKLPLAFKVGVIVMMELRVQGKTPLPQRPAAERRPPAHSRSPVRWHRLKDEVIWLLLLTSSTPPVPFRRRESV